MVKKKNQNRMSRSKPDDPLLLHHGSSENQLIPNTEGDPDLRWLILDGRRLALSHGCGQISCRGIALAVQYLWDEGHRKLIVCVPEWMKTHLPTHLDIHYLTIFYTPSDAMEASFMDALARQMDALIITQIGPDTWSEPTKRILQIAYFKNSFMLPDDPLGKNGDNLDTMLHSKNTFKLSVQIQIQNLLLIWERFAKLCKEPPDLSLSEEPGCNIRLIIIDGSNVAMSHGLDTFYSCVGIHLAVQYFWTEGYHNISVCVPNWRYNSRNTVYGHEYLNMLYKKGLLALTASQSYDDRLMLKKAKKENAFVVTNDKFRDFGEEWKDVKNNRIPFEFEGNHFKAFLKESECSQTVDKGFGSPY